MGQIIEAGFYIKGPNSIHKVERNEVFTINGTKIRIQSSSGVVNFDFPVLQSWTGDLAYRAFWYLYEYKKINRNHC